MMLRYATLLLGGLSLILLSPEVSAKVLRYSGTFVESEVLKPSGSTAIGFGTFIIDTEANTMMAVISMEGIIGDPAPVIHGPAPPGVPASALFGLPETNPISADTWNYDESLEEDILAGLMYVDIHTDLFPDGELRGQILEDCGLGRVNLGSGTAQEVLRINGSAGQPGCRQVEVPVGASITVSCDASIGGPATARYVIWGWIVKVRSVKST